MKWQLDAYMKAMSLGRLVSRGRLGRFPVVRATKARMERLIAGGEHIMIEVGGHKMHVKCDGVCVSAYGALKFHAYESHMSRLFESSLQSGNVVLDIGASLGYYSLLAARGVGSEGRVFAFEPAPEESTILQKNIQANGYANVVTVQRAVADRPGIRPFYVTDDYYGFHTLYFDTASHHKWRRIEVESTSIDEFLAEKQISSVDVMKIDIEGGEPLAIKGGEQTIRRSTNLKLFVEFNPPLLSRAGTTPEAFINQLRSMGFSISAIDETRCTLVPLANGLLQKSWNLLAVKHQAKP